ncbi:MAG TPA: glycosyltransferase family 2 protein [Rhizobiaceae bacterium]
MARFASPVTAAIVCKNEAELIGACLESVDFCAEIVVVDSGSTDGTLEIVERYRAEGFPIRLIHQDWLGYARQKQLALDHATQPWRLVIDADEQVDGELKAAIVATVEADDPKFSAWYIRRCDWLTGYGHAHRWVLHNRILRLLRAGKTRIDPDSTMHEAYFVDGAKGMIRRGLLLHMRDLTIEADVARANSYSTDKSAVQRALGRKASAFRLFLSPPFTFLKFYLLKRYILCGQPGFIYAMMMMFYSFLTEAKSYRASLGEDEKGL